MDAFAGDKILILALDTSGGQYRVSFQRANLSSSESIALTRVVECMFLEGHELLPHKALSFQH